MNRPYETNHPSPVFVLFTIHPSTSLRLRSGTTLRAPPFTFHPSPLPFFTIHPCLSPHNQRRGETVTDAMTCQDRGTAVNLFDLPPETPDQ